MSNLGILTGNTRYLKTNLTTDNIKGLTLQALAPIEIYTKNIEQKTLISDSTGISYPENRVNNIDKRDIRRRKFHNHENKHN